MIIEFQQKDGVCIMKMQGRLVPGAEPEYLRAKADELRALNCGKVLVDLSELIQIGSTGIGFIVSLYTSIAKDAQGQFVLVGMQPRVQAVFQLTRLDRIIPHAADMAAAQSML
jgi:anti-anti-sigma factor